jgi:hypothetical protein
MNFHLYTLPSTVTDDDISKFQPKTTGFKISTHDERH